MEALVENTASPSARFYCHTCTTEIDSISSEYTCPLCSQGFIEELPAQERSGASSVPPPLLDLGQGSSDYGNPQFSNEQAIRLAGEIFTNTFLSPLLRSNDPRDGEGAGGSSGAGNTDHTMFTLEDIPIDGGSSHPSGASGAGGPGAMDGAEGAAGSSGSGSAGAGVTLFGGDPRPSMRFPGRRGSRRRGMQNINNVDHILREILISVSGGATGGTATVSPFFFMGNPGDYAWGREGIDTIVTQLLNQMDNTGPPPLEKERIAEIPTVTINAEQVERKLQCSVCFEDFVIDESVRKLPCMHVYHEPCIIPWLELHGTCPICRKSLTPEQSQASPQQQQQQQQQQTQENSGTPPEESADGHAQQPQQHQHQHQEHRQGQHTTPSSQPQDGERQNVLTFRIGPSTMTNLLVEMGQPLGSSVSSSSLPQHHSSAGRNAVPAGPPGQGSSAMRRPANAPPGAAAGSSSSRGSRSSDQPPAGNSNRDDDGNIDYTLDLD